MVLSALVIALIMISLSSTISDVQSNTVQPDREAHIVKTVQAEAERITEDGVLTPKEKRNFRKFLGYLEAYSYEVVYESDGSNDCVTVVLRSPESRLQMSCIN